MLHARQLGLKLIANTTFGYTAANYSGRMPCIEVCMSVSGGVYVCLPGGVYVCLWRCVCLSLAVCMSDLIICCFHHNIAVSDLTTDTVLCR